MRKAGAEADACAFGNFSDSNGIVRIKTTYDGLRVIQLYLTLLNGANKNLIFMWKLLSIASCIFSGYAVIAHFSEHPIFGTMYACLFLNLSSAHILVYGQAFRVPALLATVKRLLIICALRYRTKLQRKLFMRRVNSIPEVGIKVGELHTMDRTSTPVFMHYLLTNVVSMLVAFQ